MDAASAFHRPADLLRCPTPEAWIEHAQRQVATLLLDHANCEKKAASTALALMFRYPERADLCHRMSRLAREELRHFEQVDKILRGRGIAFRRVAPTRYAAGLRAEVRADEPGRLVDTLVCGAFIEARSCERFGAIAPRLDDELRRFYEGLMASESRHFRDYLALAGVVADEGADEDLAGRIEVLGETERRLVATADPQFGFHSGVPAPGDRARPGQSRGCARSA